MLLSNVAELFNSPVESLCAIKDWYISSSTTTSQLPDTDAIAIRMHQVGRGIMDPLKVDLAHSSGLADLVVNFRINVYLFSDTALKRIRHTQMATVQVNIGCYNLTQFELRQITTPNHPNFYSWDQSLYEITMVYPRMTTATSGSIDLATMVEFYSDYANCGIHKLTSFKDAGMTTQTSGSDPTSLQTNPSERNLATGAISLAVSYSYGIGVDLPVNIYLKAETNAQTNAALIKTMSVKFKGCEELEASLISPTPIIVKLSQEDLPYQINVKSVFKMFETTMCPAI